MIRTRRKPVTLALGGGGARGVAHLGAIEGLLSGGFSVERIVGVSIGSLAGAMYAFDPDVERVQQRAVDYLTSPTFARHQQELFGASPSSSEETTGGVFSWYRRIDRFLRAHRLLKRVVRTPSLLPGVLLQDVVDHLLPDADIADAAIPLSVVAVDLHSGERVVLEKGPLRTAVQASASLPGIFPPVEWDDMLLCDIGVFNSLPLSVARSYDPKSLIAVDVSSDLKPLSDCVTALDVMMRMDEIGEAMFRRHDGTEADLLISPIVGHVEWFDFSACEELLEAGRDAAEQAISSWQEAHGSNWIKTLRPVAASLGLMSRGTM